MMEIKVLEIRDAGTFMPVIAIRPVAKNVYQRYLLQRDGYVADDRESSIILIKPQCHGVAYDPYDWPSNPRTMRVAHVYIADNWQKLYDGSVVDVEFILGESGVAKISEFYTAHIA